MAARWAGDIPLRELRSTRRVEAHRHRPPRRSRSRGGGGHTRDRRRPRGRRGHVHAAERRHGHRAVARDAAQGIDRRRHRPPHEGTGSRGRRRRAVPGGARPQPGPCPGRPARRHNDAARGVHGVGGRPRAEARRRPAEAVPGGAERPRPHGGSAAAVSSGAPGADGRHRARKCGRLPQGWSGRCGDGFFPVPRSADHIGGAGGGGASGRAGAGGGHEGGDEMKVHDEIAFMPATELLARIGRRDLSPVEVVDAFLERIGRLNKELNAYVLVLADEARQKARDAEKALTGKREHPPLLGLPIAIKDLFDMKAGVPNTFGCKPFKDYVPAASATYVERLERAGAIVLGKTNTPEFGHKGITDNYLFGPTSTPFHIGKNAGGSSGGSAAAVAAGLAPIAQGSDGGGSIRIPAAWCGVFGFKPSFGRVAAVARPDAFMLAVPFAHAGPLARSVADAVLMLGVMAGPDDRDPYSLPADGADYMAATSRSVAVLRIAWSPELGVFPVDPEVARVTREAVAAFEMAGAHVEEVRVGLKRSQAELCDCWMRQSAVRSAQSVGGFKSQGIDLLGAHRHEISPEFAASLELGHAQSALDYRLDDVIRTEVLDALQDVFDDYDLLVCPTLAALPVENATDGNTLGPAEIQGQRVDRLLGWCLTYPFNFTGHPAAAIPAGLSADGLPVGLQIAGRRFADESVLAASAAFEQARP